MKECEELLAARNPSKWSSASPKSRSSDYSSMGMQSSWRRMTGSPPMYEPVKEITYRMFSSVDDEDYINKMKPVQNQDTTTAVTTGKTKQHKHRNKKNKLRKSVT